MSHKLKDVVEYLDEYLDTKNIKDYSGANNGCQFLYNGEKDIKNVWAAVDSDLETIEKAVEAQVDLLIVHHGMFWNPGYAMNPTHQKKMKLLIENKISVYSSHLPLDYHPVVGNNVVLGKAIIEALKGMTFYNTVENHVETVTKSKDEKYATIIVDSNLYGDYTYIRKILNRLQENKREILYSMVGTTHSLKNNDIVEYRKQFSGVKIGICTGSGGSMLEHAIQEGCKIFITGELQQHNHSLSYEHKVDLYAMGHYNSEVFGPQDLAEHISKKYNIPTGFIETNCKF